jgi:hypothetical protein
VIGPDGRIRTDPDAIAIFVAEARRDPGVAAVVESIDDAPVGFGFFGVLLHGRLHADGREVVVKVNAQMDERTWLPAVDRVAPGVVPAMFGDGDRLGDLELGWLCTELLPHQPPGLGGQEWYGPLLLAAARWHDATSRLDLIPTEVIDDRWLRVWLDAIVETEPTPALRRLRARFDADWAWIQGLFEPARCHGDLHFFNAGSRASTPPESLVLFDPIPRLAPWPYDAATCHTLTNFHKIQGNGPSLVERFAELRRSQGLPTPEAPDVDRVSRLFCAWLAIMWQTRFNDSQPDRAATIARYVEAALEVD